MINPDIDNTIDGSITVYNLLGQHIWHEDMYIEPGMEIRLDISEWNSGTYLIQVNLGSKLVYKKLVVME